MVSTGPEPAGETMATKAQRGRVRRSRRRVIAGGVVLILVAGLAIGATTALRSPGDDDSVSAVAKEPDIGPSPPTDAVIGTAIPCGYPWYLAINGDTGNVDSGLGCEPLEPLFRRDGVVVVRAYRGVETADPSAYAGWWGPGRGAPPPRCFPERYVHAGLSTDEAVGLVGGPLYAEPLDPIVASHGFFGVGEGSPVAWAVVQVHDDVHRVRVNFEAGAEDAMETVEGVAVLAAPVPASEPGVVPTTGGIVDALDASGVVVASAELPTGQPVEAEVLGRPDCRPEPPPLPEADGPPPDDEEEAQRGIIEAYTEVYAANTTDDALATYVDDPRGVAAAFAAGRGNVPAAFDVLSVLVQEVKFLNSTSAAVRYDILLPGYAIAEFPDRIGRAVLVDGDWTVARETICADLQLAGATCNPQPYG